MSIQSEIDRINQAKTDLAAAIESKGVIVPPNTTINVYPGLVQQIEQGAGLPAGGTPGQMLYHGESGPEWGDKPVMYVNVTGDDESGYTADKTAREIYEAVENDIFVSALNKTTETILEIPLYTASFSGGNYSISFAGMIGGTLLYIYIATISNREMVSFSATKLSANDVTFTPGTTGLTAKNVQDAIEEVNEKIPSAPKSVIVTLPASGWSSNAQTVTVQGVLADESAQLIQPMPAIASQNAYITAGVICSGQAANQLTFTCTTVPTEDLSVYVVIQGVSA